jgi:putative nucleotidyltransferase with HDIG domain
MRFAVYTFLWSFVPFGALLALTFAGVQNLAVSTIRRQLQDSLRQGELAISRARQKSELQNSGFLSMVAENAALKAGMQLARSEPDAGETVRRTIEDQLFEIAPSLTFDFFLVANPDGMPLAAIILRNGKWNSADVTGMHPPRQGFYSSPDGIYQISSVPVNQRDENLGSLSVGELVDLQNLPTGSVLTREGKVLKTTVSGIKEKELEGAIRNCPPRGECVLRLAGHSYISLVMQDGTPGRPYALRVLEDVDAAAAPLQWMLTKVFLGISLVALLAAFVVSFVSSKTITKPIYRVVASLRDGSKTGVLPNFDTGSTSIQEIRELMLSFNRAAGAVRRAEQDLKEAYVQFIGTLASALDARDPYTAGHSRRVSEKARAVAAAMQVNASESEFVRVGALLHDIGKIGITDAVLQKAGRLTEEEFEIIRQHPTIGRRIIEAIEAFRPYIPIVELHHENWDGSGYPMGLSAESVPLGARIVHVVDAYDAMTSDRPYRRGMSHEEALGVLKNFAGTQFDPEVVAVFESVAGLHGNFESLRNLATAVGISHEISNPVVGTGVTRI